MSRDSPQAYAEGREAWLDHISRDPSNTTILYHASVSFTLDDRALAIEILEKAQAIDGSNPKWARRLGLLHRLNMRRASGEAKQMNAEAALA